MNEYVKSCWEIVKYTIFNKYFFCFISQQEIGLAVCLVIYLFNTICSQRRKDNFRNSFTDNNVKIVSYSLKDDLYSVLKSIWFGNDFVGVKEHIKCIVFDYCVYV